MHPQGNGDISRRLQRQIAHIVHTVPYYRHFGVVGNDPWEMLGRLPVITKSVVKNAYGDFISDEFAEIRPSLVRSLCPSNGSVGFGYEAIDENAIVIGETSGSSGAPFRFAKTMADRIRLGRGIWWQRAKVDPFITPKSLYRFIHQSFPNTSVLEPWRRDPQHILALYDHFAKSGCRWLHTCPEMLLRHISVLESEGAGFSFPHLRFIECSGSFLTGEIKARLGDYFGAKVVDQYGTRETWTISLTCCHGDHHINEQNVLVEILDDEDKPVPVGVPGRIVVTSLQTKLLPFIRYATNDYGMFRRKTCDCNLGTKTIQLVEGRDFELIGGLPTSISGRRLFHRAIVDVMREIGDCKLEYVRIVQTDVDEFLMKTNEIANAQVFRDLLCKVASDSLARPVRLRHALATEAEMRAELRRKPCLFRREKPSRASGSA